MESLYRWVTTEGESGVSCEECAAEYGWFIPEKPSPAEVRDQSSSRQRDIGVNTPTVRVPADDQDAFGKWVVRGIAIAIGFFIVEIPLVLIAMWWLDRELSKIGP
jgi:hypothetical protein